MCIRDRVVQTKPLSPERLKELAVLLPPMRESVSKPIKFEAPSYTRHPPHTSDVIKLEFPPKTSDKTNKPSRISQSPLKILRVSHKGAVSSVAALTITFNQAMVPVTSAEVSNNVVPVKLSPLPPGVWHWLSTDTLEFRPTAKRFPNATTFKVAVSPGTTSLVGLSLIHISPLQRELLISFRPPNELPRSIKTARFGLSSQFMRS